MKKYDPPKKVMLITENGEGSNVDLIKYDDNGIVFYDEEIGNGKKKIFVPYSNIACIQEV
jgi:hypothetical protein